MMFKRKEAENLRRELRALEQSGIQMDSERLKENICSQFPEYRLWIREYIVNAFDAQARSCWVAGREDKETITITVTDDGSGMDREGVEAFMTKFRSLKHRGEDAVGRFGIGSFSVAAIPGQCGFSMSTSTGQETWRMATGGLLDSRPVTVEQIAPVLPRGTTFAISFSSDGTTLTEELLRLQQLARAYLYHLPINIHFNLPSPARAGEPSAVQWNPGNWLEDPVEQFSRRYCFNLGAGGKEYAFDVIMAIGPNREQIYQNRVLIAENREDYDLLAQDLEARKVYVAHLSIRVESPHFDLPLGRHCLRNTDVLKPLARHLRERILPQYLGELADVYETGSTEEFMVRPSDIEDMISTWMATAPGSIPERSRRLRVFRSHNGKRLSYDDLSRGVDQYHALYLEATSSSGLDYTVFDAPVLSLDQPQGGLELIKRDFEAHLINLSMTDLVQEAPAQVRMELTPRQKRFSKMLGFSCEVLQEYGQRHENSREEDNDLCARLFSNVPNGLLEKASEKAREVCQALEAIEWCVGFLVGRDGKKPCKAALFLCKGDRVVLNLYHSEIAKLVHLSEVAPNLAGHFATAMCLSAQGHNAILQHLAPEDREELIHLDAIRRCGRKDSPPDTEPAPAKPENGASDQMKFKDFLRHVSESNFKF